MSLRVLLFVSSLLLCAPLARAQIIPSKGCMDTCMGSLPTKTVCGVTDIFLNMSYNVSVFSECYWESCTFTNQYYGYCGCPNDCYTKFSFGVCENNKCKCALGYRGPDCSQVDCEYNNCTSNGECVLDSDLGDYCSCKSGFTGPYCSTPMLTETGSPYGTEYSDREYYFNDTYGDEHPVFNASVIAVINIEVDVEGLLYVLTPWNAFNQTYVKGNFTFINGNIKERFTDVGIKLKGSGSRRNWKKNWKISFSTFVSKTRFHGLKQLALKASDTGEPQIPLIVKDMLRAINQPIQRASLARLYINGVNYGLYWVGEEINDVWLQSYFKEPTGNLYKGTWYATLDYLGSDPDIYKNFTKVNWGRWNLQVYEQPEGDGNYTRFAQLIEIIDKNITSDENFTQQIVNIFDVEKFLQYLPVEIMIGWFDGYSCGSNNYFLYDNPESGLFEYVGFDFDGEIFGINTPIPDGHTWATVDPFAWCTYKFNNQERTGYVLTDRILKQPVFKQKFAYYFRLFLDNVWASPSDKIMKTHAFVEQELQYDYAIRMDLPYTENFTYMEEMMQNITNFLEIRYQTANEQIPYIQTTEYIRYAIALCIILSVIVLIIVVLQIVNRRKEYQQF